jgi:small subunit ribosomal protein S14
MMTATSHTKILNQIKNKPGKIKKFEKYSVPKVKNSGKAKYKCSRCGRNGAHIQKYGLHLCRHCFREVATKIGFTQYS